MTFYKVYRSALYTLILCIILVPAALIAPLSEKAVLPDINVIAFVPSQICFPFSSATLDKSEVYTDASDKGRLIVTLRNCSNQPLVGLSLYLTTMRGSLDYLTETSEDGYIYKMGDGTGLATVTGADGKAYFDVSSEETGDTAIYITADNVVAFNEVPLTFTLSPIVEPVPEEPVLEPEVPTVVPEAPETPVTPTPSETPGTTYQKPRIPKERIFINEKITEILLEIPAPVAYSFPYILFLLFALLGLVFLWQVRNETKSAKELMSLIKIRKLISDEKQNFLNLASHYLRTPVTIMKGYLDTANNYLELGLKQKLQQSIKDLDSFIANLLGMLENNEFLKGLVAPNVMKEGLRQYLSLAMLAPVISVIALSVIINYVFHRIGTLQPSVINTIMQIVAAVLATEFFILAFRRKKNAASNLKYLRETLEYEESVDLARNQFIKLTEDSLTSKVTELDALKEEIIDPENLATLDNGLMRLGEITYRLEVLGALESGQVAKRKDKTSIALMVKEILEDEQEEISQKNLEVELKILPVDLAAYTSGHLLRIVLENVIDNAIKFSEAKGKTTISASIHENIQIEIKDRGVGIPKSEMLHLFRPFARTTSVATFNYEGMGFNLYLSKIILEFLGGNIEIHSKEKRGTTVLITLPKPENAKERLPKANKLTPRPAV